MLSTQTTENAVRILREISPRELDSAGFVASDSFYEEFDSAKAPVIAFLTDRIEEAILNASGSDLSEEFLNGYLDGVASILRLLAELKLVKNT